MGIYDWRRDKQIGSNSVTGKITPKPSTEKQGKNESSGNKVEQRRKAPNVK